MENSGAIKHIRIRSRIRIPVSKFAILKEKARGGWPKVIDKNLRLIVRMVIPG